MREVGRASMIYSHVSLIHFSILVLLPPPSLNIPWPIRSACVAFVLLEACHQRFVYRNMEIFLVDRYRWICWGDYFPKAIGDGRPHSARLEESMPAGRREREDRLCRKWVVSEMSM